MRFMMMIKGNTQTEAGELPDEKALAAMAKYNQQLVDAGVLLDGAGLQASSQGARITFSGGKPSVKDGPFAEAKELIAGYWIIQVKSKAEAIEWARRVPFNTDTPHAGEGEIELRRMFDMEDFEPGPAVEQHKQVFKEVERQKAR
jgi:hypothetical protein